MPSTDITKCTGFSDKVFAEDAEGVRRAVRGIAFCPRRMECKRFVSRAGYIQYYCVPPEDFQDKCDLFWHVAVEEVDDV